MNEVEGDFFSSNQSPTTPVSPVPSDTARPCGDTLKTMNPTPNGYSSISNHKPKVEGQDIVKKNHDSSKHSEHHNHSSDHVKKKESDHSPSKPKDSSKDSSKHDSSKEHHSSKEKKHHSSSHKEHSKSKDGSNKHSESSNHSSSKKEDKIKTDSIKKEHGSSSSEKPRTDNFKENEKIKDGSKESKHKDSKDKHKDKHKDKSHKDKSSSKTVEGEVKEKSKEKHGEHKEKRSEHGEKVKSDKHKEGDKHKEKHSEHKEKHNDHKDKHGEKSKEKHSEKSKEKHSEKSKEKHSEKSKEKHSEKSKEKHGEKSKEKHGDKAKSDKHKDGEKHKEKSEKVKVKTENSGSPSNENRSAPQAKVKPEPMSEEDEPLAQHLANSIKREAEDSAEEKPRPKKKIKTEKKRKAVSDDEDEYDSDYKKPAKKIKKEKVEKTAKGKGKNKVKEEPEVPSPRKRGAKKEEEEQDVWKWWEEEKLADGLKWRTLEHLGPVFPPPYERVPKNVKFYYEGKHIPLSEVAEEVAGFYGRMLDHDYTTKDVFNTNFFKDWRKVMTPEEKEIIKDLSKCNFKDFDVYYKQKSEERKNMSKEEKQAIKKENEELTAKYGFCIIDGHKQKIGNFRIEPPGLFRGRGEHPKMGMLKRRVVAEDILINIGKEAKVPAPPPGHKWKEVRHDNTVSWLASWNENILGSTKYIMLNPSSKLKGEKDWQKYETARKLKAHAHRIREEYTRDFKSKEMRVRQRAVALYFIDKLALRAGNEKDEETADTVGCCSLRVEHITLDDEKDGQEYVVSFDFLGKDSIRYVNSVAVEKRAYKNLKLFMDNKQPGDDLFDRLNTSILNKYLMDLMEGLTAKVFRTYNASKTLQEQLDLLTKEDMSLPEKILAYNRANREVAILCNHQRAVPKGFSKSMEALKQKIDDKVKQIKETKKEFKELKQAAKNGGGKDKMLMDKKKKRLEQLEDQLKRLEIQATDREENKQIALGTSKLNYLDPRISVAWCKKWDVPIEKVYNKTQRDKFRWAIEMAGPDFKF